MDGRRGQSLNYRTYLLRSCMHAGDEKGKEGKGKERKGDFDARFGSVGWASALFFFFFFLNGREGGNYL